MDALTADRNAFARKSVDLLTPELRQKLPSGGLLPRRRIEGTGTP